ncbi:UNVERIFIED_CONTAM: hypothetical protein FKN15_028801 [Acipenser sinensis]
MAAPKVIPKDAQVMTQILKDMGITEYEPRVINQMLEFTYRYVTTIIEDAKIYSTHAKKSNVDADDVRLAIQCRMDQSFTSPPPRDFLLEVARQKNQTPLPLIKPYTGPRLPPDRYCLTAPNYRLKSLQKKVSSGGRITVPRLSVGAMSSRPSTPTIGTPVSQSVTLTTKVGTPVSLSGQRFTVQIPSSQSSTVKSGKFYCKPHYCYRLSGYAQRKRPAEAPLTAKENKVSLPDPVAADGPVRANATATPTERTPAMPSTPTVQNVLINPSLIGSKNILITTSMVSSQSSANESNALKRKHEDEDDYDTL